ncbi:MAG: adenylosuccinate lyase [Bernardetiaceae bacterium]|nr:adenylosuccinate lyase [Bernardetiaceae bacterium]
MPLTSLNAISPIDGRYRSKVEPLTAYFSEYALIRYRVWVEVEYFIALCQIPLPDLASFQPQGFALLRDLYINFDEEQAQKIKDIEAQTNHDVKAVEYYIKAFFDIQGWQAYKEYIHFGLTSQDINNTATPMLFRDAILEVQMKQLQQLIDQLRNLANDWKDIPMLARTHGQPASPTRLGKEIEVFVYRLEKQKAELQRIPFAAKFGGATGNFNAHHVAFPHIDWQDFAKNFVDNTLELERSEYTTQIENYDFLAAHCDAFKRINTILIDLARDMWTYISMDYFKQRILKNEVGSSAMPHKVNPIDFENAEGNLGLANAIFTHLSEKLPISRLQRDLTDSTVLRNLGTPIAHSLIAYQAIQKGLSKLELNSAQIHNDLGNNWAVVAEAIQTVLRREKYPNPYEALKALTRTSEKITEKSMTDFIAQLDVSPQIKAELKAITPFNYTGV